MVRLGAHVDDGGHAQSGTEPGSSLFVEMTRLNSPPLLHPPVLKAAHAPMPDDSRLVPIIPAEWLWALRAALGRCPPFGR